MSMQPPTCGICTSTPLSGAVLTEIFSPCSKTKVPVCVSGREAACESGGMTDSCNCPVPEISKIVSLRDTANSGSCSIIAISFGELLSAFQAQFSVRYFLETLSSLSDASLTVMEYENPFQRSL